VLADNVKRSWKQIIYFDSDKKHEAPPTPGESARRPLPSAPRFQMDDSVEVIRDERGVRLAARTEDSD
jgi:hypothetical protein